MRGAASLLILSLGYQKESLWIRSAISILFASSNCLLSCSCTSSTQGFAASPTLLKSTSAHHCFLTLLGHQKPVLNLCALPSVFQSLHNLHLAVPQLPEPFQNKARQQHPWEHSISLYILFVLQSPLSEHLWENLQPEPPDFQHPEPELLEVTHKVTHGFQGCWMQAFAVYWCISTCTKL